MLIDFHCFGFNIYKSMRYCIYMIISISFLTILRCDQYLSVSNKKSDLLLIIEMRSDVNLTKNLVSDDRSKILTDQCNRSNLFSSIDIKQSTGIGLIHSYPWLNAAIFPLQSKSLMYCSIPKIASKTLISLIVYVYIDDLIKHLNQSEIEKHIDMAILIQQLEKVFEK